MSRIGRGVAWSVILVSTLFILGYLLNAEGRPSISQETNTSPGLSVVPATESDEGEAVGSGLAPEEAAGELMPAQKALVSGGATSSAAAGGEEAEPEGEEAKAAPVDPEKAPRIKFDTATWDFGAMYQNEKVSYEFVYRNVGKGPLRIEKVKSTCGCTAAEPSHREVLPGQQGTINVTFSSGNFRDRVTKLVYVDTNDPEEPRVTLTITGVVKIEVQVTPIGIYVGQMKLGTKAIRTVDILPVEVSKFKLLGTKVTDPAISVMRTESVKKDGKKGYRLVVQYGPVTKPGRVSASLLVQTDLKRSRDITIRVYGRVLSPEEENEAKPEA